ncbi:hypothetical protein CBS101457_002667 [Exobasidium rhododendri]|nr:hypothetical protein CBS101457_002667 [Exobasidium rhododendri]
MLGQFALFQSPREFCKRRLQTSRRVAKAKAVESMQAMEAMTAVSLSNSPSTSTGTTTGDDQVNLEDRIAIPALRKLFFGPAPMETLERKRSPGQQSSSPSASTSVSPLSEESPCNHAATLHHDDDTEGSRRKRAKTSEGVVSIGNALSGGKKENEVEREGPKGDFDRRYSGPSSDQIAKEVRYHYVQAEAAKLDGVQLPELSHICSGTLQLFIDGEWTEVAKRGIGINDFAAMAKHLQTEQAAQ